MKTSGEANFCIPSITVQVSTLQGPVGLLGFGSLMISKQFFPDSGEKLDYE